MSNWRQWYSNLQKPAATPSPATINLIWKVLYPIIFITYGYVFYLGLQGRIDLWTLLPFLLNLIFNVFFTPIQFGLKNLPLALLNIIFIWGTIIWTMIAIWPYSSPIALLQIPYFLWVTIATYLQFSLMRLNKGK